MYSRRKDMINVEAIDEILSAVKAEALHALTKGKYHSHHESYGVLLEEVDEYWEEVKKKASKRNKKNTLKELIQIAAIAIKTIDNLNLMTEAADQKTGQAASKCLKG